MPFILNRGRLYDGINTNSKRRSNLGSWLDKVSNIVYCFMELYLEDGLTVFLIIDNLEKAHVHTR